MNEKRTIDVLTAIAKHNDEKGHGHLAQANVTPDEIEIVCARGLVTKQGRRTLKGHAFTQARRK